MWAVLPWLLAAMTTASAAGPQLAGLNIPLPFTADRGEQHGAGGQVEVINWRREASLGRDFFEVEGVARNQGRRSVRYVEVLVKAVDASGNTLRMERDYTNPPHLDPGETGSFSVLIDSHPRIAEFKLETQWHRR